MKPPTPLTDAFLENLKNQMKTLKIRKKTLALGIGTYPQTLNRWLHGIRKPTGEFILKIIEFMKDKISMFL